MAFEPAPECHATLIKRFAGEPTFLAFNGALGETDGTVVIEMASAGLAPTHRIITNEDFSSSTRARTVAIRSAKSICESHPEWFPNAVKVGAEGHDGRVVDGFSDLLTDTRLRSIGVEIHFGLLHSRGDNETPAKINRKMRAAGFVVCWTDPSHVVGIRPRPPRQ